MPHGGSQQQYSMLDSSHGRGAAHQQQLQPSPSYGQGGHAGGAQQAPVTCSHGVTTSLQQQQQQQGFWQGPPPHQPPPSQAAKHSPSRPRVKSNAVVPVSSMGMTAAAAECRDAGVADDVAVEFQRIKATLAVYASE